MAELFLNPWAMTAGALLVSAPIIIHLINRIRFRRVRWAAMEFLLKSQKKQQRKLLIEQLILLALRCLLVLLAGLLLARFVGKSLAGAEAGTRHIVVLDDTPSMGDFWTAEGKSSDSFALARQYIVEQLAQPAAQASGAQTIELLPLTDPEESRTFELTSTGAVEDLRAYLEKLTPSAVHASPAVGLDRARAVAESNPKQRCLVHFVSDFRAADWSGRSVEDVKRAAEALAKTGAQLHLHDVAHPYRQEQRTPISHDNLAVVDLQPETHVVARFQPVEFFVTLANYSGTERKNLRVIVKLNGDERAEASFPVPVLPPGLTQRSFILALERVGKADKPRERFNIVTASLDKGEAGLAADKTRFVAVEVREKLRLLMVEGTPGKPDDEKADGFHLRKLYADSLHGFEVVSKPASELELPGLSQYTGVFVLNVPRLSDKARQNLEAYVRGGGGLAFFLGEGVKPDAYNQLYDGGKGLFPVPIADKPTDSRWLTPMLQLLEATAKARDERERERVRQQLTQLRQRVRVFVRNEGTPLLAGLYRYDRLESFKMRLPYIPFDRYYPVPRARWGAAAEQCDEVLTFPNDRSIDDFKDEAQRLAAELPESDPRFARFAALLRGARQKLVQVLANGKYLFQLADEIEDVLTNRGDPREPDQPSLHEFWQQSDVAELRTRFAKLLEAVRYGDPLLVAKSFGQGRVVASMSTAGLPWNSWPVAEGKQFVSSYVAFGDELQRYLNGGGVTTNDLAGRPIALVRYEPERFAAQVQRSYLREEKAPDGQPVFDDLGPQEGAKKDGLLTFAIDQTRKPGVYVYALPPAADRPDSPTEFVARAVNLDALAESDLRRAGRDDLTGVSAGTMLHFPGSTQLAGVLRPRPRDWSESAWLFALILLVLVAEQAMAVRLSFHVKGGAQPVPARPAAAEVA